jgi:hypothetical protein
MQGISRSTVLPLSRNVSDEVTVSYKFTVAAMSCPYLLGRGEISVKECKFKHKKKEKRLEVIEEVKGTKRN